MPACRRALEDGGVRRQAGISARAPSVRVGRIPGKLDTQGHHESVIIAKDTLIKAEELNNSLGSFMKTDISAEVLSWNRKSLSTDIV